MTRHDLQVLDTIETTDYMKGELSDDGWSISWSVESPKWLLAELDIPAHMVPPNPDDSDSMLGWLAIPSPF